MKKQHTHLLFIGSLALLQRSRVWSWGLGFWFPALLVELGSVREEFVEG
jgi:hypothetical protein